MGDKAKNFAAPAPKTVKIKRPTTVSVTASSSRTRVPPSAVKERPSVSRPKINKNTTVLGDGDLTMLKQDGHLPDFDTEQRQVAYGKLLRSMLEDCLLDEKFEREETQIDIQMGQLADRFQKTIEQLDKTSRRLKDINFMAEQQRLISLKNQHCDEFYKVTSQSKAEDILKDLNSTEEASLDKLHTKNIDFGYNTESGHKQLLDAVNDAIDGLEQIKKHSKLDVNKFKEYEDTEHTLDELEKDRMDLESLKSDFEAKFPQFSQRLLREASERITQMISNDDIDDDD